jgi:hypothetical protein
MCVYLSPSKTKVRQIYTNTYYYTRVRENEDDDDDIDMNVRGLWD